MNKNKLQIYIFSFLGIALILFALWPWLAGFWQKTNIAEIVEEKKEVELLLDGELYDYATSSDEIIKSSKQLKIDSIGVDIPIVISDDGGKALGRGAWHIPGSGLPSEPEGYKNIVLSAHRFLYTSGPHTFFNLDKVEIDDEIDISWEGEEHKYKVVEIFVVEPDQVSILEDDGQEKLTLFTCTPVFTTDKRLVVIAYPVE